MVGERTEEGLAARAVNLDLEVLPVKRDGNGLPELRMDEGCPFAQIYAPPDLDAVAFEPMTAPTNALVSGEDLRMLPAGESFSATFTLKIADTA